MVASAAADHAAGRRVWWLPTAELAAQALRPRLREGDVLITIGAGDVFKLADALVEGDAAR
jgi:UDP-N-acetylmuramate--alanine ligase